MKEVTIYTDGCCLGNPGPGGYGAVLLYGPHRRELSQGYRLTTNNRMELLACIVALKALKEPCRVTMYSDSKYVVNSIEKGWVNRWQRNNWMRNKKEAAKNPDLWQEYLLASQPHQVSLRWVRGHAGNTENERCDQLAKAAAQSPELLDDPGFDPATI